MDNTTKGFEGIGNIVKELSIDSYSAIMELIGQSVYLNNPEKYALSIVDIAKEYSAKSAQGLDLELARLEFTDGIKTHKADCFHEIVLPYLGKIIPDTVKTVKAGIADNWSRRFVQLWFENGNGRNLSNNGMKISKGKVDFKRGLNACYFCPAYAMTGAKSCIDCPFFSNNLHVNGLIPPFDCNGRKADNKGKRAGYIAIMLDHGIQVACNHGMIK